MWGRVDLIRLVLILISIISLWFVVYAQSGEEGPCNTCPAECIGSQCARRWWTTMWGFVVTLIALTMDVWGYAKTIDESTILAIIMTFFFSALNPLLVVFEILDGALGGMAMVESLREALGNDIVVPLYPWRKSHIKIIVSTDVYVNLSPDVHEGDSKLGTFSKQDSFVENLSEALVLGRRVEDSNQYNVQLSLHGKLALLRSNVLPPYDQLKILRGSSSMSMAIVAAQAIGYIYGIVVRCVQGLRVCPVEAIAGLLSIVSLIKVVLHNFASLGHRPLLLYLSLEEESKFILECKNVTHLEFEPKGRLKLASLITIASMSALVAYFIINFLKYLNTLCLVPIIIFEVTLVLAGVYIFLVSDDSWMDTLTAFLIVLLNLIGYVWAVVVTFKYWKAEKFDVQSSNYLSQVLPYIG